jgi:hypothetical protein
VGLFHVRALQTTDDWGTQVHLLHHVDQSLRDRVTADDAAENVDKDCRYFGVAGDQVKGGPDGFGRGTATDVEEICWRATIQFDDVHRCHGQAGAIYEAANVAVQFDEVQSVSRKAVSVDASLMEAIERTRQP